MITFLYYLGYFTAALFVIQTIMLLTGGDIDGGDTDIDVSVDADEISMFSYLSWKNLINFLALFSWSTIGALEAGVGTVLSLTIGLGLGLGFVLLMILIWKGVSKLESDGTFDVHAHVINKEGILTTGIDAQDGKLSITVANKTITGRARSTDGQHISTSSTVTVVGYENDIFTVK